MSLSFSPPLRIYQIFRFIFFYYHVNLYLAPRYLLIISVSQIRFATSFLDPFFSVSLSNVRERSTPPSPAKSESASVFCNCVLSCWFFFSFYVASPLYPEALFYFGVSSHVAHLVCFARSMTYASCFLRNEWFAALLAFDLSTFIAEARMITFLISISFVTLLPLTPFYWPFTQIAYKLFWSVIIIQSCHAGKGLIWPKARKKSRRRSKKEKEGEIENNNNRDRLSVSIRLLSSENISLFILWLTRTARRRGCNVGAETYSLYLFFVYCYSYYHWCYHH